MNAQLSPASDAIPTADELVRHQRGGMLARADQDHRDGGVAVGQRGRRTADEISEMLEAIRLPAVLVGRLFLLQVPLDLRARQARHALDGCHREGEELVVYPHDERLRDRQRERQPDREARTVPRERLDEQSAAELLDLGRNDVHADAAPGLLRQAVCRAESGLQYQLQRLLVSELLALRQQPHLPRLRADGLHVQAGPVVLDGDDDLGAFAP